MTEADKMCLVLGATGQTGKALVQKLINDKYFDKIVIVSRREIQGQNNPKVQTKIVNFEDLNSYRYVFSGVSVTFCCIGSSLTKVSKVSSASVASFVYLFRISFTERI